MTAYPPLRPVLDGPSWIIGPSPYLAGLLPPPAPGAPPHECVDHCVFQSADGAWHLWGCIRGTSVGRILYHWEGQSLTLPNWTPTGEIIRVDRHAGESIRDRDGKEWIQSPYVVRHNGTYFMFYGGHSTGLDAGGTPVPPSDPRMEGQICLMTSPDGRTWTRHRDKHGHSRLFVGPGETRDPCVIKIGDTFHLYYAGYHNADPAQAGVYLRTSPDLLHWSGWQIVHQDPAYGPGPWGTECPHVVKRRTAYYLFRTEHYATAKTHVFCSQNPADFGAAGDASDKYVATPGGATIAVAAPEIITDRHGRQYITSNHDLLGGTRLFRLRWEQAHTEDRPAQRLRQGRPDGTQD
ncbi:MAG: hypothetical protein JXA93_17080 [Anaerolineae bacterium]|nr:hypothetical protein [Anaerolineae bacterium]